MIQWSKTAEVTPEPGRELIAKNTQKKIWDKYSGKKCELFIFAEIERELIQDGLMHDNYDLWAYTDEADNHE